MKEEMIQAIRAASCQIKANANWFAKNYATVRDWLSNHNENNNVGEFIYGFIFILFFFYYYIALKSLNRFMQ
jgi:hypothetical protein